MGGALGGAVERAEPCKGGAKGGRGGAWWGKLGHFTGWVALEIREGIFCIVGTAGEREEVDEEEGWILEEGKEPGVTYLSFRSHRLGVCV